MISLEEQFDNLQAFIDEELFGAGCILIESNKNGVDILLVEMAEIGNYTEICDAWGPDLYTALRNLLTHVEEMLEELDND